MFGDQGRSKNRHKEYVRIVSYVGASIDNLKGLELEQEQMLLTARLEHIRLSIDGTLKPFKSFPRVRGFHKQYDEIRSRYKF